MIKTVSTPQTSIFSKIGSATLAIPGRVWKVGKTTVCYSVQKIINGLAHGINLVQKMPSKKISQHVGVNFSDQKAHEIKQRMIVTPATDSQIEETVNRFGVNIGSFIPMRLVDQFLTGKIQTVDFYFDLVTGCTTSKDYREVYFKHLDASNLFFLIRWIAKLTYIVISPFFKKTIQQSLTSLSKKVDSDLKNKEKNPFNAIVGAQLQKSNELLKNWNESIEKTSETSRDSAEVKDALKKELQKPEYHNGMKPSEFYNKLSSKIVDDYLVLESFGKKLSRILVIDGKTPLVLLNIITIPLLIVLKLLLLLPEHIITKILSSTVKNNLNKNRFLETILEKTLGEISTSIGLTTPVLKALNGSLEEIIVDFMEKPNSTSNNDLQGRLSKKNKEALKKNVRLVQKAVNYYNQETIQDLKYRIKHGPSFSGKVDKFFNSEIAKGIKDVMTVVHKKLSSQVFIKQQAYNILGAINNSFETPKKETTDTYVEEEKRFFSLLQTLLTTVVKHSVSEAVAKYGVIEKGGAAFNLLSSQIYDRCYMLVEKTINMNISHEFLRFVLNDTLNEYFGKDL